jgi:hypothetical protein
VSRPVRFAGRLTSPSFTVVSTSTEVSAVTIVVSWVVRVVTLVSAASTLPVSRVPPRLSHPIRPTTSANPAISVFICPPKMNVPVPGFGRLPETLPPSEREHCHSGGSIAVTCLTTAAPGSYIEARKFSAEMATLQRYTPA